MALADDVQDRLEDQLLIELTNPDDRTATTINATLLGIAVTDVEGAFELYAEIEYDGTEKTHVMLGVQAVRAALEAYNRLGFLGGDAWDAMKEELRELAGIGARARVTPQTDSVLTRSSERVDQEIVRPWADRQKLRHVTPDSRADDDDDDL